MLLSEAARLAPAHELDIAELAQWMERALGDAAVFPVAEVRAKRLPQLVVFTYLAAPPRASAAGLRWAAEFLFAFFLFNDHYRAACAPGPQRDFIRAWRARVESELGPASRRFLAAFEQYQQSLAVEHDYEAQPEQLTLERYVDPQRGRYQWVATSPYIDLWELTVGAVLAETERQWTEPLKVLGVELTYLANDIGSLGRDRLGKNYVTLSCPAPNDPEKLQAALDATLRLYAEKVARFQQLERQLPDRAPLRDYAELVAHVTDGNLQATSLLSRQGSALRYAPWLRAALDALPLIRRSPTAPR